MWHRQASSHRRHLLTALALSLLALLLALFPNVVGSQSAVPALAAPVAAPPVQGTTV